MTEHIVATYETQAAADAAARELQDAGFPASAIRQYKADAGARAVSSERTTETASSSGGGFWAWLLGEENAQTTRTAYPREEEWYGRRAEAGDTILIVSVTDEPLAETSVALRRDRLIVDVVALCDL